MILNYIKISLRNFKKRFLFTIINVLGLAIGIASFLLIFGYVTFEKNYDDFHKNKDFVYRILLERYKGSELKSKNANVTPGLGNRIKDHIEDVKYVSRYTTPSNESIVKNKELYLQDNKLYYVDNDFLEMFSFNLIEGNKEDMLERPHSIVLTESTAKILFKDSVAIGEELEVANDYGKKKYTVTGIVKDPPKNSRFNFNYLCSFNSINHGKSWFENNWSWFGFETYLGLKNEKSLEKIKNQFPQFINKYKTDPNEAEKEWIFKFQPLNDINLNSDFSNLSANQDSKKDKIVFLQIISILVLLISWVNYVNLSTANSMERAREIGVRKAIGAFREQISGQFLVQSVLVNFFALIVSLLLVFLLVKPFYSSIGLIYNYEIFSNSKFWIYALIIFILSIVFSGLYPALVASKYKSTEVLKSKTLSTVGSSLVRKLLIGIQFLISLILITSTFIIIGQNDYLKNKDLGINISEVYYLSRPLSSKKNFRKKYKSFISELNKINGISSSSASFAIPSKGSWGLASKLANSSDSERQNHTVIGVDENYVPLYDIDIIAGRNFRSNEIENSNLALISLNSMKNFNISSPQEALGKKIKIETFDKEDFEIIGVIDNYHHQSIQNKIETMILVNSNKEGLFKTPNFISFRKNKGLDRKSASQKVETIFHKFFKKDVFELKLIKNNFSEEYKEEDINQFIFSIFSFLAIILSFVGVLGLSFFILVLKEKEIAIRKVIGCETKDIIWVLSKEFVFIFGIMLLLSIPIVVFLMNNWLSDYPYRIDISPVYFIKTFLLISLLLVFIISFSVVKSLKKSAIKVLKEE